MTNPAEIKLDTEKVQEWIKKGAKPTESALSLIKRAGIEL